MAEDVPRHRACPRCNGFQQLDQFAGQWTCLECGHDFAAPIEWVRAEDHDRALASAEQRIQALEEELATTGVDRIARERARQISVEGWTSAHDDTHADGTLTAAACCYATLARRQADGVIKSWAENIGPSTGWPWDEAWWKPSDDPVRNLEKAGALIAAEIDRLQRRRTTREKGSDV